MVLNTEAFLDRPPVADESREAAVEFSGLGSFSSTGQSAAARYEAQPQDLQPIEGHVDDGEILRDLLP